MHVPAGGFSGWIQRKAVSTLQSYIRRRRRTQSQRLKPNSKARNEDGEYGKEQQEREDLKDQMDEIISRSNDREDGTDDANEVLIIAVRL